MGKITKNVALLVGTVALAAVAGLAQAETRFAVQDAAGTTDKMVVTDTGNIGVGLPNATVPAGGLHVKGGIYPNNVIRADGNEATQGAGFIGYTVRSDGALPKSTDRLGFFLFGTSTAAGTFNAAGVSAATEADWTGTSTPAYFGFFTTAPGQNARNERLRITGVGNVGIGTTTPTQKLEVAGALRLNTTATKPATCTSAQRGTIWLTQGAAGVAADSLDVCMKIDAAGTYNWVKITP